jgi:hypothetical protein
MATIDVNDVRSLLSDFEKRCAEIRAIGGISLQDVVNGTVTVPHGWVEDPATFYFVPSWWRWDTAKLAN